MSATSVSGNFQKLKLRVWSSGRKRSSEGRVK